MGKATSSPYTTIDDIQKITIQTTGNATDFGNISRTNVVQIAQGIHRNG